MKVSELIEQLKEFDGEFEVDVMDKDGDSYLLSSLEETEDIAGVKYVTLII